MSKTLSFAAIHFSVAFSLGYLLTGNWLVGGLLALVEPACNTVAYHFHEKLWARRRGGTSSGPAEPGTPCVAGPIL